MKKLAITITLAVACSVILSGCSRPPPAAGQELIIAAASNLTDVFEEAGKRFTEQSGVRVVYSFGGTADLAKQIENGAPFDLFAAADTSHIDVLDGKGLIAPGTRALYARGRLVLWTTRQGRMPGALEGLAGADVRTVAVPKPDVAPYGKAAVEALTALGLWPEVGPKVVYGMNVSQVKQYVVSGNADVGFIPLSLVRGGEGQYVEVDEKLHQPIDQAIGVIKASPRLEYARRFVDFVLSAEGQALLQKYGYNKPPGE